MSNSNKHHDWYKQTLTDFQRGAWQQVEARCGELLQRERRYALAWHLRGLAAYRQGEGELALKYLRRAVRHDGANAQYRTHLSDVLRSQGQLEQAVAAGKKAVRLEPQLASAHNNLALALLAQGKLAEAEASFCGVPLLLSPPTPKDTPIWATSCVNRGAAIQPSPALIQPYA